MYEVYVGDLKLVLLPETLKEKIAKDNKKYNVLAFGEVVRPGRPKLKTWSINTSFELEDGDVTKRKEYLDKLALSPDGFRFIVNRFNPDGSMTFGTNTLACIESLEWEDPKGSPGSVNFKLDIIEFKHFEAKVVNL